MSKIYILMDCDKYDYHGVLKAFKDHNKAWAFNETYNFENNKRGVYSRIVETELIDDDTTQGAKGE